MPQLDDWEYDDWGDAAQRGLRAESSQRRYKQSQERRPPTYQFAQLDKKELRESVNATRAAFDSARAALDQNMHAHFSNQPDAEELAGLTEWERDSLDYVIHGDVRSAQEKERGNTARVRFETYRRENQ